MRRQIEYVCTQHPDTDDCPDKLVRFIPKFQEYGLLVHDGPAPSSVLIGFCPWCGARLPDSQRERWFNELERLGIEDPDNAPVDMQSEAWLR